METIWLILLLILGLTSESALIEPHGNELSKVVDKGQQRLSTNNTLELVDVSCKTVTAYFNGTFQRQDDPNLKFDAQFQIKLQVSMGRIFFQIQHWNSNYLDSSEVYFDISIGFNGQHCYLNQPCVIPIPSTKSDLYVQAFTHSSDWFGFELLLFPSFLNEFTLKQAYQQCTNYQESENDFPNPNLYQFCACCGEYNPDPATICPKSSWQEKPPC